MECGNLMPKEKAEARDKLKIIRSDFFLRLLFIHLERKRLLNMVKYNKNIKKRINININNYKEYSETFTPIEIEIKPIMNEYCEFINIQDEDKLFYHIYFNNSKEEVKRNYINENEKIKLIKIIIDNQIKSLDSLFSD